MHEEKASAGGGVCPESRDGHVRLSCADMREGEGEALTANRRVNCRELWNYMEIIWTNAKYIVNLSSKQRRTDGQANMRG